MPNKDYEEKDGDASLASKVKGSKGGDSASFKPLSHPHEGAGDDQEFGGFGPVKVSPEMPQDKEKKLPKAGGLA